MTFGEAVVNLNVGKMLTRAGWNGKNMFVFMQVPASIPIETVPKMQSLPLDVKDEFERRHQSYRSIQFCHIHYNNQLALVNSNNGINGWAPSVSDALATDWEIYTPA